MHHLRRDQIRDLLEVALAHRERDFVWILIGFWHGLRISEIMRGESRVKGLPVVRYGLTPANFVDGFLVVQRLKGSMPTAQRLHHDRDSLFDERAAAESWIARHRKMHGAAADARPLFPISRQEGRNLMRLYCRRAEIPAHLAHPHVLKHSMCMIAIKSGIEYARQRAGHRSISSTGDYLKISDVQADDAFERAFNALGGAEFYRPSRIPPAASPAPLQRVAVPGMTDTPTRAEITALKSLLAKIERADLDPAEILENFEATTVV